MASWPSVLALCVTPWMWGGSGRPRPRLGGRSPATAYHHDRPDADQIWVARQWIAELRRRAAQARQTMTARADPEYRLDVAPARDTREASVRGLATRVAKDDMGTAPAAADRGRYPGGVMRHLSPRLELEAITDRSLELRVRQRHLTLQPIRTDIDELRRTRTGVELAAALVERALEADSGIKRQPRPAHCVPRGAGIATPVSHLTPPRDGCSMYSDLCA